MTTVGSPRLTVEPVAGALGATVRGLDLSAVSDPGQLEGLRRALADHLVVFLPDQQLDLDGLECVTDLLGGRDITPFVDPLEDRPYVIRVIKEPTDVLNFANAWHSDLSYLPEPPAYTLAARLGGPVPRGRHRVVEPVPGLRDALAGTPGHARRPRGGALRRPGVRHRRAAGQGEGLHVHGDRALARGLCRARPPGRGRPPGDGAAGALREPDLHRALQGMDQGRVAAAARAPLPLERQRELHLPAALVGAHADHLGQPLHHAQRAERLLGSAPRDVPHQCQGSVPLGPDSAAAT